MVSLLVPASSLDCCDAAAASALPRNGVQSALQGVPVTRIRTLQLRRRTGSLEEQSKRIVQHLRGGSYFEDVEPLELGLEARDVERLHCDIARDGSVGPMPPEHAQRVGNISLYDEMGCLDEQGATDGFPFDVARWRPDARFHLGFRAPLKLPLNRSMYSSFDERELVVVQRPDGAPRFAQVLERKSEGFFRGELQVGHQYRVLLEPPKPGCLPAEKILDAADIGKLLGGWTAGRDALDEGCRLEAAGLLRQLGNRALNASLLEDAARKYVKALAYLDGVDMHAASSAALVDEWIKVRLNLALVQLRSKQLHECVEGCNAVLQVRSNETKALYRSGLAYKALGDNKEAARRLLAVFRERPGDIVLRRELSLCYDDFAMFLAEVNPILDALPPEKLQQVAGVWSVGCGVWV